MTNPNRITPTVGRKVWFRPNGTTSLQRAGTQGVAFASLAIIDNAPLDATVVYVWNDRMVNLLVLDHYGNPFTATSVPMVQPDEDCPAVGFYAEWMPYQQGQARRDAAIDRAITATTPFGAASAPVAAAQAQSATLDLGSDAPLAPACDLSGDGTCEACQ